MNGDTRQYRSFRAGERGVILAWVLILLGLITVLALQAQWTARMTLRTGERKVLRNQLRAAATDAAWGALIRLADDADLRVDHTNEPWAVPEEIQLPNGIDVRVRIEDENRRFDVNSLSVAGTGKAARRPLDMVADLLALSGQPNALVQAQVLRDWIDADHAGLREADYYRNLVPPVTIADTLMESPRELVEVLALLESFNGEVPAGLMVMPAHSSNRGNKTAAVSDPDRRIMPVNLNTADRDVIMAVLGPDHAAAAEILCGIRDAGPLASLTVLDRVLKTSPDTPWNHYLDVKSSCFSVIASAAKDGNEETVHALVHRDPQGQVDVIRWVCR